MAALSVTTVGMSDGGDARPPDGPGPGRRRFEVVLSATDKAFGHGSSPDEDRLETLSLPIKDSVCRLSMSVERLSRLDEAGRSCSGAGLGKAELRAARSSTLSREIGILGLDLVLALAAGGLGLLLGSGAVPVLLTALANFKRRSTSCKRRESTELLKSSVPASCACIERCFCCLRMTFSSCLMICFR